MMQLSAHTSSTEPLIRLSQAGYHFQPQSGQTIQALSDINLQVFPGDRIALIGPSGAGKSTLLRLLNGTLFATQGEVWAFDRNLAQLSPHQRRKVQRQIGMIYQQFHLVHPLRVIHNVNAGQLGRWKLFKALGSLLFPQGVAEARAALEQVGIPEKLWVRTNQLSGGQQQRVAIARVLIQNPAVVLADEPIASLDPERGREVMTLLAELCGEPEQATQRALVVSLHDLEMARMFCDRIIGLREGKIIFDCAADQLDSQRIEALYQLNDQTRSSHNR